MTLRTHTRRAGLAVGALFLVIAPAAAQFESREQCMSHTVAACSLAMNVDMSQTCVDRELQKCDAYDPTVTGTIDPQRPTFPRPRGVPTLHFLAEESFGGDRSDGRAGGQRP